MARLAGAWRSSSRLSPSWERGPRTSCELASTDDWEEIGRAHGEVFGEIRPASAMLVITGLLDPRFLVEIEADAIIA
jgi:enamine deaminase RidA (YjgF/YER057c/UK114 family)